MREYGVDELLAIKEPEGLFENDAILSKKMFRQLSMRWHPDHGGNEDVFKHVKYLYEKAEDKIRSGTWHYTDRLVVKSIDGRTFEVKYLSHRRLEVGDVYVSPSTVVYLIDGSISDLVPSARRIVSGFKYADKAMEEQYSRHVPHEKVVVETVDGRTMVAYDKTSDQILLRDVLDHFGGRIDPRHVAWMITRLYYIASYLSYTGIMHGHISPDTLFVSPQYHSVSVLGGWWYAAKSGDRLKALPARTIDNVSPDVLSSKVATPHIDLQMIRVTGLELLGDIYGSKLLMDKSIPKPMLDWLRDMATSSALAEYAKWEDILLKSFGPRKFVEFNVSASDIYSSHN